MATHKKQSGALLPNLMLKFGSELLFDVISTAYERFSLIVTTNLPFENWAEVLVSRQF
ncbi:ATP-binding protein [Gimesia sp.]|uniref:ATP-binding protein n=1 Tax=Gimesia sp. TaxID=2024833 RepID=UPI0025BF6E56|nr:ATP-binding protein [Gimesia sp.]